MDSENIIPEYLDAASTTPCDPRVVEAMLPYFDEIFGNASSNHIYGKQAKAAVEKARKQVASIINADADDPFDLDKWQAYEEANPSTFSEMYQFWCQKID